MKIDINNPATKTVTKIVPFDLQKLQSVKADDKSVQVGLYIDELFIPLKSFQVFTSTDDKMIIGDVGKPVDGIFAWTVDGLYLGSVDTLTPVVHVDSCNNLVLQVTEQESTQLSATLHLENEDDIALITALIGNTSRKAMDVEFASGTYNRLHDVVFKDLNSDLYQKYKCMDEKYVDWLKKAYGRTL